MGTVCHWQPFWWRKSFCFIGQCWYFNPQWTPEQVIIVASSVTVCIYVWLTKLPQTSKLNMPQNVACLNAVTLSFPTLPPSTFRQFYLFPWYCINVIWVCYIVYLSLQSKFPVKILWLSMLMLMLQSKFVAVLMCISLFSEHYHACQWRLALSKGCLERNLN
jgi:hypothetical protein